MKSNDTYLNLLASFAYLGKQKPFCEKIFNESKNGNVNLMIDSGAFTLFNAKDKSSWLTLDNYCSFLDNYGYLSEKYVMLDVIGNDEKSKENYEIMLNRGFNPMFVFTMADNDFDYLQNAVNNNPHLCVAGGVTTKGDWMTKRFQDVYSKTQAKIHGLGYVTYPKIFQLPLASVDSSSLIQAPAVFGTINYFDNGLKSIRYIDILKGHKKMPKKLMEMLEMVKITPKQFSNLENHKGGRSIAILLSVIAYVEYQKLAKTQDLNLFLAVANEDQLNSILDANEQIISGIYSYEKFKSK